MPLPAIHVDFARKLRPFLIEYVQADVKTLHSHGHKTPIHNSDFFANSLKIILDQVDAPMQERVARMANADLSEVKRDWQEFLGRLDNQTKTDIFRLYKAVDAEYHCFLNFYLFGGKVFHITDGLTQHLLHTELKLPSSTIELPFQSCIFSFTSPYAVDALYQTMREADKPSVDWLPPYDAPITVSATLQEPHGNLPGRRLALFVWHSKAPNCFMAQERNLYLPDDWNIEQSLKTDWDAVAPDESRSPSAGLSLSAAGSEKLSDDFFYTDGLAFYRLVVNSILYLNSSQPEVVTRESVLSKNLQAAAGIKSPKNRKKRIQESNRESMLDYSSVGESVGIIVVNKGLPGTHIAAADSSIQSGVSVRFMVRGHWRNQAHGTQLNSRKLMWIRPYLKGPDMAELINRPYEVK